MKRNEQQIKPDILKWLNMSCYCGYLLKTINAFTESEDHKWSSKKSSFLRAMTARGQPDKGPKVHTDFCIWLAYKKILGEDMVVTFRISELSYKQRTKY